MPNPKNCQHDAKSHHSIIFFYLYNINHTPTKLNPTNQTPISNSQFLIVILNSQTATLKQGSSNKTTTKKNRQSQSPTDFLLSNNLKNHTQQFYLQDHSMLLYKPQLKL